MHNLAGRSEVPSCKQGDFVLLPAPLMPCLVLMGLYGAKMAPALLQLHIN